MNRFFYITFFICCFIFSFKSIAQQEFSFSQYMFSHQTVNPAYAGSKKVGNFTTLHRSQWVGFEGSPVTQSFTFNGPFNSKNLGFGISAVNDRIGPILNTSANFDLSYHLRLNEADTRLSVGLKLGLHNYNLDSGLINTLEPSDQTFVMDKKMNILPNIGFGLYLYSLKWYLGISVPKMIENDIYNMSMHGYLISGALFNLAKDWQLKPSLFVKYAKASPLGYDISTLVVFKESFWLGPQLRTTIDSPIPDAKFGGGFGIIAGLSINKNISLGYSYGSSMGITSLGFNNGTHEVMLRYELTPKVIGLLRSPRIF